MVADPCLGCQPAQPDKFDATAFLKTLTSGPGVYRMVGEDGTVLYVGKARNLKRRVASYFRQAQQLEVKTRVLMSHTATVEIAATHTETEALLLENTLIKEHLPHYNILLRDDKSFPYIFLSSNERFPALSFHRGPRRRKGRYFGPFAGAGAVRETLGQLKKLFRVRQCEDSFFRNRSRPCLQYQIERCTAPCVGYVGESSYQEDIDHAVMFLEGRSQEMIAELVERMQAVAGRLEYEAASRYRDQISALRRIQEHQYVVGTKGDIDVVAVHVEQAVAVVQVFMIRSGQNLGNKSLLPKHAEGASPAEILSAFLPQYYLSAARQHPIPAVILTSEALDDEALLSAVFGEQAGHKISIRHRVRGERLRWLRMARENAALAVRQRLSDKANLQERFEALRELFGLEETPSRIECFDVSHSAGEATVASCVVFGHEGAITSDYRRFNIRGVEAGDDYAAMRQALLRRYTRLQREDARLPDLVLVDGGRGQLKQAVDVMQELQLSEIQLGAVAKGPSRRPGHESLFVPGAAQPLPMTADAPGLHLIQQIRDEAHRFAITGHRGRRARSRRTSTLESIAGIGAKRRQRLLLQFGGLQGVARAGVEDLAGVQGISTALAQNIYDAFRNRG